MPPDRGSPYGQPPYGGRRGGGPQRRGPYGQGSGSGSEEDLYGQHPDFQATVDALADPLSDPLPGQPGPSPSARADQSAGGYAAQGYQGQNYQPQGHQGQNHQPRNPGNGYQGQGQGYQDPGYRDPGYQAQGYQAPAPPAQGYSPQGYTAPEQEGTSPWFRPHREQPAQAQTGYEVPPAAQRRQQGYPGQVPYDSTQSGRQQRWQGQQGGPQGGQGAGRVPQGGGGVPQGGGGGTGAAQAASGQQPRPPVAWGRDQARQPGQRRPDPHGAHPGAGAAAAGTRRGREAGQVRGPGLSETASLPAVEELDAAYEERPSGGRQPVVDDENDVSNTSTVGLVRPEAGKAGRAARRRAAQRQGRSGEPARRPAAGTRLEARRAARARREGPAIIASRFLGEVFISAGVLMLLFVAYQLWWTNVLAGQEAGGAAQDLQDQWKGGAGGSKGGLDPERRADSFAPGEGFALLYIPKLDVRAPIAQGTSKPEVLDKGLVGHYGKEPFKSAMPWDKKGNFALAAHRNTHGEPFRYINRLVGGDEIVVETATKFYTYKMANRLPSTSPANTSVIKPVPPQSGFKRSGRYITLTTCTPEFTSKYRLIVWGKMVEERPRSKGKPDALVG